MPLRKRLAWVSASAVALAVVIAAIVCYVVVRNQLLGQVDSELQQQAGLVSQDPRACNGGGLPSPPASAGGGAPIWQVVNSSGGWVCGQGNVSLPVDSGVLTVAGGNGGTYFQNTSVGGADLRELIVPVEVGQSFGPQETAALQLARPLGGVNNILRDLRLVLLLVCAGGIALAAALGRLAAGRVIAPLAEVAATAQHIEETEDLSSRIRVHADDEVGQLARRFNAMIERLQISRDALDESVRAQRQLVADASHELRTPITSLRTNIEVLLEQGDRLTEEDRRRLLADVLEQSQELSGLIGDVIELARGDLPISSAEDVQLDRVVEESLGRARRDFPHVRFEQRLDPVIVEGVPERLHRAINNLLDNAAHHSPRDGVVEVVVDRNGVRVRDHGTGIDESDLPYVFDRFYRGANSRHRQGSGLGLAIVRQVATQHGGSIDAVNAPDGGALFTLHLPTLTDEPPDRGETPQPVAGDALHTR
ncbi:MAG TPA: HAMP domain-containing sensor histidine kinase [Solirubrobacteraceae bacterium]|nr:HAMP domain-containing sensor histidine kinase [Solirubrobacteraceae bacterium]